VTGLRIERREPSFQALRGQLAKIVLEADVARGRKLRQAALAQLEHEVAAPRDLDGVGERLGQVGEQLRHVRLPRK